MTEAILVVEFVNAALVAGANLTTFLAKLSGLLQLRHAKGETLQREDLAKLFDDGDALEAAVLERAKAALG